MNHTRKLRQMLREAGLPVEICRGVVQRYLDEGNGQAPKTFLTKVAAELSQAAKEDLQQFCSQEAKDE